jgi:hypothetical protein
MAMPARSATPASERAAVWLRNGLEAGAELGVPIGDSPFHADPKPRLSFTIGYTF